jgi:hypothetical protein
VAALLANRATTALPASVLGANQAITVQPVGVVDKAILEEWDPNFGRLNAVFGIVTPAGPRSLAYADRPTETLRDGETTLWRIAHTGVDAHPVHFHFVNVQVVARVNADGTVEAPPPEELGWKETVKMNPAQDIIVAFRPKKPELGGFTVPASVRMLDPTQPAGVPHGFTQMDPATGLPSATPVVNALADLSWEYVWHCHILGHEENDFMRVVSFIPNETAPLAPGLVNTLAAQDLPVQVVFTDNAHDEYAYTIERAVVTVDPATQAQTVGAYAALATLPAQTGPTPAGATPAISFPPVAWKDSTALPDKLYSYRVSAVGSQTTVDPLTNLSNGLAAVASPATVQVSTALTAPAAPTASNLTARGLTLSWNGVGNATGYKVEQSTNGGTTWSAAAATIVSLGNVSISANVSGLTPATAYALRVVASNTSATPATSQPLSVTTPAELLAATLAAPATSVATVGTTQSPQISLVWANTSTGQTGYQVERATVTGGVAGAFALLGNALAATATGHVDATVAQEIGRAHV